MGRIAQILEGWRNHLIPPEHLKELIKETSEDRLLICRVCINNSIVAKKAGVDFHSSWRPDEHCILCQCVLSAKTSCLSCSCPIDKWIAVVSENEDKQIEKAINGETDSI